MVSLRRREGLERIVCLMFVCLFGCLFNVCLFVCLFVCLMFVCLFVCLFVKRNGKYGQ